MSNGVCRDIFGEGRGLEYIPCTPRNGQFPAKLRHVPSNPNVPLEVLAEDAKGAAVDNPVMQMIEEEVTGATSMEQDYHGPNATDMVHYDVRMDDLWKVSQHN